MLILCTHSWIESTVSWNLAAVDNRKAAEEAQTLSELGAQRWGWLQAGIDLVAQAL